MLKSRESRVGSNNEFISIITASFSSEIINETSGTIPDMAMLDHAVGVTHLGCKCRRERGGKRLVIELLLHLNTIAGYYWHFIIFVF